MKSSVSVNDNIPCFQPIRGSINNNLGGQESPLLLEMMMAKAIKGVERDTNGSAGHPKTGEPEENTGLRKLVGVLMGESNGISLDLGRSSQFSDNLN